MQIAAHKVVSLLYTLRDDEGDLIDQSSHEDPFAYIHGVGNIIPGLENALTGRSVGDHFTVHIAPEDGYGVRNDALVQAAPIQAFHGVDHIEPGMQFQAESEHGVQLVTVISVTDDEVLLDGNHPLAGQALNFDVEVLDIRDATPDELAHGHVHGAGCHHH